MTCQCGIEDPALCAKLHPVVQHYDHEPTDQEGLVDPAYDTCQECGRCLLLARGRLICWGCDAVVGECECAPLIRIVKQ